jgi:hypothetical protein
LCWRSGMATAACGRAGLTLCSLAADCGKRRAAVADFRYFHGMQWIPHAVLVASMWCTAVVASPPQARATAPHSLDATRAALDAARARVREQSSTYHDPVGPRTWIDGARLWYCETARDGARRWWLVDASAKGDAVKVPLFDHAAAAEALAKAGRARGPGRLPVREIAVERTGDGASVRVALEGLEQPLAFALGASPLRPEPRRLRSRNPSTRSTRPPPRRRKGRRPRRAQRPRSSLPRRNPRHPRPRRRVLKRTTPRPPRSPRRLRPKRPRLPMRQRPGSSSLMVSRRARPAAASSTP